VRVGPEHDSRLGNVNGFAVNDQRIIMSGIYCWTWCGDKHCLYGQRCQQVFKANERLHRSPQQPVVPQRLAGEMEQSGVFVQGEKDSPDREAVDVPQSAGILPCPFCGAKNIRLATDLGGYANVSWMECDWCNARGPSRIVRDGVSVVAEWNKRAGQTDSQGHVGR
jgi:Lar family restriction alleviation protein